MNAAACVHPRDAEQRVVPLVCEAARRAHHLLRRLPEVARHPRRPRRAPSPAQRPLAQGTTLRVCYMSLFISLVRAFAAFVRFVSFRFVRSFVRSFVRFLLPSFSFFLSFLFWAVQRAHC